MSLEGKTAIVTGAASGFGAEIARAFVAEGADVVLVDRDAAGLAAMAEELGAAVLPAVADVSDPAAVAAAVAEGAARFGHIDVAVNNAGIVNQRAPAEEMEEELFDRLLAVNLKSLYGMTRAVVPLFRAAGRGGSIVNIGSTGAIRPRPGLTWYNATKGAVHAFSKSLAVELAPLNVRVNCIAPVMAPTGMLKPALGGVDTEAARAGVVGSIPLGRLCAPQDVANACVWLAQDASAFITGAVIPVDGGRTV